jgi:hypothetical protein
MVFEITEYEPSRTKAYRTVSGPSTVAGVYLVESVAGNTKATTRFDMELKGAFRLAGPLMNRTIRRQWESSMQNLKRVLEAKT